MFMPEKEETYVSDVEMLLHSNCRRNTSLSVQELHSN